MERQNRLADESLNKVKTGELDKVEDDPTTAKDEKARATLAAGKDVFGRPITNAFGYTFGKLWGNTKSFFGIDSEAEREKEIGERLYNQDLHQEEIENKVNNDKSSADKAALSGAQKNYENLTRQYAPQIEQVKVEQKQLQDLIDQGVDPSDMRYVQIKKSLQAKYQGLQPLIDAEDSVIKAGRRVQGNELKDNLYVEDVFGGDDKLTNNYFNEVRKDIYFKRDAANTPTDELAVDDDRTSNIQTATLQFENSLLSQEKERAQKMVEAGMIASPAEYLGSQEFLNYMKGNVASYKNALAANYDKVKNVQGGVEIIDGSKLRETFKTNPAFQGIFQGVETYDTDKNSQISALGVSTSKKEGGIEGNAKALGYYSQFVFNEWNKEIR